MFDSSEVPDQAMSAAIHVPDVQVSFTTIAIHELNLVPSSIVMRR